MQAPNKVYILPSQHNLQYDNGGEEYIRKDALLEWAEKKKNDVKKFGQRYNEANYYNSGCHDTIQELIDKINSL